jgi:carbon-monoxide dehydrogenase large subunit
VYAVIVRSPYAHARIVGIDASAAREESGIVAILTAEDTRAAGLAPFTPMPGHPAIRNPRLYSAPMLAAGRVRCVGDPVAIVIGQTLAGAKDAAERVSVEYEPLPPVVSIGAASASDAPLVWDEAPGNVACEAEMGSAQAVARAFAAADHVERLTIANNRLSANAMEPRVVLAAHDSISQRTTVYTSHQAPHRLKQGLAQVLGVPETDLRVVCPDVGGGFGMKSNLYVEDALITFASRHLGRPVKWTAERAESLMSDAHARDRIDTGEIAFARDGRMLGIRVSIDANLGAYVSATGQVPAMQTLRLLSSVYAIPAIHGRTRMYYTNTTPIAVYRGAGRPEAMHLVERIIDAAAIALRIEPDEIRRRNHISPEALP